MKQKVYPNHVNVAFLEQKQDHKNSIEIYVDGSKTDNGSAYAVVINNTIISNNRKDKLAVIVELNTIKKVIAFVENC